MAAPLVKPWKLLVMDDKEIIVRLIGPEDLGLLLEMPEGLFDNPVDPAQARAFLAEPANLMVLALAGGAAVAFASGTVLRHPDKAPQLFINEVGTRESHQRQGLARRVTEALIAAARAKGVRTAWLGTEAGNAAARGLYRSLGGSETEGLVMWEWEW